MLERFFDQYHHLACIPIRISFGLTLMIEAYTQISAGLNQTFLIFRTVFLLMSGLFILFGFFTRLASLLSVILLILFFVILPPPQQSALSQKIPLLLTFACAITLIFLGSGKLSLENYFGFK